MCTCESDTRWRRVNEDDRRAAFPCLCPSFRTDIGQTSVEYQYQTQFSGIIIIHPGHLIWSRSLSSLFFGLQLLWEISASIAADAHQLVTACACVWARAHVCVCAGKVDLSQLPSATLWGLRAKWNRKIAQMNCKLPDTEENHIFSCSFSAGSSPAATLQYFSWFRDPHLYSSSQTPVEQPHKMNNPKLSVDFQKITYLALVYSLLKKEKKVLVPSLTSQRESSTVCLSTCSLKVKNAAEVEDGFFLLLEMEFDVRREVQNAIEYWWSEYCLGPLNISPFTPAATGKMALRTLRVGEGKFAKSALKTLFP